MGSAAAMPGGLGFSDPASTANSSFLNGPLNNSGFNSSFVAGGGNAPASSNFTQFSKTSINKNAGGIASLNSKQGIKARSKNLD